MKVIIVLLNLMLLASYVSAEDCKCNERNEPPTMILIGIAMGIAYLIIDKNSIFHHPSRQRYGLGGLHTGENYYSDDEYSEDEEEEYEGAEADSDGEETEGEEPEEEEEEEEAQQVRSSARLRRRNV